MAEYMPRHYKGDRRVTVVMFNLAKDFLKGVNWCDTKKLGRYLGIPSRHAGSIFRMLGWKKWSHSNAKSTYHRPGVFSNEGIASAQLHFEQPMEAEE